MDTDTIHHWLAAHLEDPQHILQRTYSLPEARALGGIELSAQYREMIVEGCLREATLAHAIAMASYWIALASQASVRRCLDAGLGSLGRTYVVPYGECLKVLDAVRTAWIREGKSLTEFQPNFIPPPPAHGV